MFKSLKGSETPVKKKTCQNTVGLKLFFLTLHIQHKKLKAYCVLCVLMPAYKTENRGQDTESKICLMLTKSEPLWGCSFTI